MAHSAPAVWFGIKTLASGLGTEYANDGLESSPVLGTFWRRCGGAFAMHCWRATLDRIPSLIIHRSEALQLFGKVLYQDELRRE